MESILKENQVVAPKAFVLDRLFERLNIVDPGQRSRVRQGLGVGLVSTVIVLNAALTFI